MLGLIILKRKYFVAILNGIRKIKFIQAWYGGGLGLCQAWDVGTVGI